MLFVRQLLKLKLLVRGCSGVVDQIHSEHPTCFHLPDAWIKATVKGWMLHHQLTLSAGFDYRTVGKGLQGIRKGLQGIRKGCDNPEAKLNFSLKLAGKRKGTSFISNSKFILIPSKMASKNFPKLIWKAENKAENLLHYRRQKKSPKFIYFPFCFILCRHEKL